jgi:transposase-like protein
MPLSYSRSARRQVAKRLRNGEPVADIAAEAGISPATLFRWKAQALIDAGVRDGVPGTTYNQSLNSHNAGPQTGDQITWTKIWVQ